MARSFEKRSFVFVALIAIALGIVARFDSLDRKVFWRDESFSILRVSGHNERSLYALFDNAVHGSDELTALMRSSKRFDLRTTLSSLHEEPQRGPLYYLAARIWIDVVGDATANARAFSAALGIVGIGIAFLLGRRVIGGVRGGLVLASLVAVSPIDVRYSQQLREYVLVTDLTLLATLLLLRAIDRPRGRRWLLYGLCVCAGLYTNVTFGCVAIAHGVVALAVARERIRAIAVGFGAAATVALAAYAPWAYAAARGAGRHASDISWTAGGYSFGATATKWAFNVGAVFFDAEYAHRWWGVVLLPLITIAAVAIAHACGRRASTAARVALAVACSTALPLFAIDFVGHSHLVLVARYEMPTWAGIVMLVSVLLGDGLRSDSARMRVGTACAFGFIVVAGAVSLAADRPYTQWWDNNDQLSESRVADVIRAGPQPALVISEITANRVYDAFVLARYLSPRTPMLLVRDRLPTLPTRYAAIYLFTPSRATLDRAGRFERSKPVRVSPPPEFLVPALSAAGAARADAVDYANALWFLRQRASRAAFYDDPAASSAPIDTTGAMHSRPRASRRRRKRAVMLERSPGERPAYSIESEVPGGRSLTTTEATSALPA